MRRDWDDLAILDPRWAILSDPAKRFDGWERESFMRTGRETVAEVLASAQKFGVPRERARALDFGCGLGRLTYALAEHFEECLGVDISPAMIEQACVGAPENCRFEVTDLAQLPSEGFDLVLSQLVLQHVPSASEKSRYIRELVRVLRPGGLLAFQLPERIALRHRLQPRARAYEALRPFVPAARLYRLGLHPIRMTALPRQRVETIVAAAGGRMLTPGYLVTR